MYEVLLVAHIAVLGYWLGAELVINANYRYVCYRDEMPFSERDRLLSHVMDVDQHVRYALVLQATIGTALAMQLGLFPGGQAGMLVAGAVGALWLVFVEAAHRLRNRPAGKRLAAVDRGSRYVVVGVALLLAAGVVGTDWLVPAWLRWKLALFAAVILCGVGIRIVLLGHYRIWSIMGREGATEQTNTAIHGIYRRATAVLAVLWLFLIAIVFVSVSKPT